MNFSRLSWYLSVWMEPRFFPTCPASRTTRTLLVASQWRPRPLACLRIHRVCGGRIGAQVYLEPMCLEDRLPAEHRARLVWQVVERLDLSRFYESIAARGSAPGRPTTDPKLLVALWLYATIDNVGSARRLARLCEEHDAYRWLCGGVSVNHHLLSDFRVGEGEALDELLTPVAGGARRQRHREGGADQPGLAPFAGLGGAFELSASPAFGSVVQESQSPCGGVEAAGVGCG